MFVHGLKRHADEIKKRVSLPEKLVENGMKARDSRELDAEDLSENWSVAANMSREDINNGDITPSLSEICPTCKELHDLELFESCAQEQNRFEFLLKGMLHRIREMSLTSIDP